MLKGSLKVGKRLQRVERSDQRACFTSRLKQIAWKCAAAMHHSLPGSPASLLGYFPAQRADSVVRDSEEHQVGGVKGVRPVTGSPWVETRSKGHFEAAPE